MQSYYTNHKSPQSVICFALQMNKCYQESSKRCNGALGIVVQMLTLLFSSTESFTGESQSKGISGMNQAEWVYMFLFYTLFKLRY